jgi:sugar (glycoside-pentoside-hexuronide) transporter
MIKENKLAFYQKIFYGAGELSGCLSNTIIGFFYLYYLTDIVKLQPALAGIAILIGKLWDSFADPLFGSISDRTKSRWGRRRVYLLLGTLPLGFSFFLLWILSPHWSQTQMFLYATISYIFHMTSLTAIVIPYQTLTAEMSSDYDERTSLIGFRMAFNVVGSLSGVVIPKIITGGFSTPQSGFFIMGIVFAFILGSAPFFPFMGCRENLSANNKNTPLSLKDNLKEIWNNKPFKWILVMFLFTWTAINLLQTMFIYFFKYWMNMENSFNTIIAVIFITSALFIPLWVKLSKSRGKRITYIIGVGFLGICIISIIFFNAKMTTAIYVMAIFIGIGMAAAHVMPHTIIPDSIDYGEYLTGERHEGLYFGFLTFVQKVGTAAAIGFSGIVLQYAGYNAGAQQSSTVLWTIRILFGPVPGIFLIIGIICIYFYPIDKKMYSKIHKKIESMRVV